MFQQQRFCFGMCNSNVYLRDIFNQRFGFTAADLRAEIARKAFFQVFGLADIDNRAAGVIHAIDAGLAGYGFKKGFCIKTIIHRLTTSPH
ncbi:Uncharacterised protein [Serratia rubidaea]|uniref:Uncharacterized protein n=1 Tax=Serratia rubidaea TaxID=61652 RepID=A0A447QSS4_SERRU|nr:Uncharacterised protein [Serratia rubidaea]